MLFVIGFIVLFFTLLAIEGQHRKRVKQNEEILELLKQINEKL